MKSEMFIGDDGRCSADIVVERGTPGTDDHVEGGERVSDGDQWWGLRSLTGQLVRSED